MPLHISIADLLTMPREIMIKHARTGRNLIHSVIIWQKKSWMMYVNNSGKLIDKSSDGFKIRNKKSFETD